MWHVLNNRRKSEQQEKENKMAASTTKLTKRLVLVAITAILIITMAAASATLILSSSPQLAQAQQGKGIDGRGTGQVECPSVDGEPGIEPIGDETIFFTANKEKGTLSGFGSVSGAGGKSLGITGGHIGSKQFTLTGIEEFDTMCGTPTPSTFTITGQCGHDVPIQFRSSTGQEGEFVGNVVCSK